MNKALAKISIVVFAFLASSCATVFNWDKGKVAIDSYPKGASVFYEGTVQGKTPCLVQLKKSPFKKHAVELKKEGYADVIIKPRKHIHWTAYLNGINCFIPLTVDLLTGRYINYELYSTKLLKRKQGIDLLIDSIKDAKNLAIWDSLMPFNSGYFTGKFKPTKKGSEFASRSKSSSLCYYIYTWQKDTNKLVLSSYAVMNRAGSWKRERMGKKVLTYHKTNFDICEVYRRKFIKQVIDAKLTKANYKTEIERIYLSNVAELNQMKNKYTKETGFSKNKYTQALWAQKVKEELNKTAQVTEINELKLSE